jgi:hypothetical protein
VEAFVAAPPAPSTESCRSSSRLAGLRVELELLLEPCQTCLK